MISAALTDELSNLAAIVYRPEDDADSLLREFATALIHKGHQIGGLVQRNEKDGREQHAAMALIDLMTGCVCPISQAGRDCKLDPGALANAALAIGRALDAGVELVIVNKFSTQEAAGKGLRNELATAVATGLPVLTAVPEKHFGAWQAFSGGFGTTMACERTLIDDGWQENRGGTAARARVSNLKELPGRTSIRRFQIETRLRRIAYHAHSLANDDVRRLDHRGHGITDFEAKVIHGLVRDGRCDRQAWRWQLEYNVGRSWSPWSPPEIYREEYCERLIS